MSQHDHETPPRQAVTDQLLRETLGGQPQIDLTDRVLSALDAGEAEAAGARAEAAADGASTASRPPSRWLIAALMLLGLGVVAVIATQQGSEPDARREAVQDPRPSEDDVVQVTSLGQLRRLLAEVSGVSVEVLRLDDPDVAAEIELAGPLVHLTDADRVSLVDGIARTARLTEPAGWIWQNKVRLHLEGDNHVLMSVYTHGRGSQLRLGMQGLGSDFLVGEPAASVLREALDTTETVARLAHCIVLEPKNLVGEERYPVDFERLRLFLKDESLLRYLIDYENLQELDVSGMRTRLTHTGLDYIGDCGRLRSLDLSGLELDDDVFAYLLPLTTLEHLTMRGVRGVTGTGFQRYTNSSSLRSGPWSIDLSRVRDLTADGLECLMAWGPRELQLERCDLDDQDLRLIAHAPRKSLVSLSIRGNPTVTSAGILELLGMPNLERLDVRDCDLSQEEIAALLEAAGKVELLTD